MQVGNKGPYMGYEIDVHGILLRGYLNRIQTE